MSTALTSAKEAEPQTQAVKVTLYLDANLREWFREHCEKQGIAQSRLMAVLLRRYRDGL